MIKKLIIGLVLIMFVGMLWAEEITITGKWHTIKWGETIKIIATHYGVNPHLLAGVNDITNWDLIIAGDLLWIPISAEPKVTVYTVQKGEYLLLIAAKFKVPVWSIAKANGIYNLNVIHPGQKLVIPAQ